MGFSSLHFARFNRSYFAFGWKDGSGLQVFRAMQEGNCVCVCVCVCVFVRALGSSIAIMQFDVIMSAWL
jgi:hypothetical protein